MFCFYHPFFCTLTCSQLLGYGVVTPMLLEGSHPNGGMDLGLVWGVPLDPTNRETTKSQVSLQICLRAESFWLLDSEHLYTSGFPCLASAGAPREQELLTLAKQGQEAGGILGAAPLCLGEGWRREAREVSHEQQELDAKTNACQRHSGGFFDSLIMESLPLPALARQTAQRDASE